MTPIGAYCNILFDDGDQVDGYYISFSEPPSFEEDENPEGMADKWGINDDYIFYYAPNGEIELKTLSQNNLNNDFKILSYELEYKND